VEVICLNVVDESGEHLSLRYDYLVIYQRRH
jgi:hypothetical protein